MVGRRPVVVVEEGEEEEGGEGGITRCTQTPRRMRTIVGEGFTAVVFILPFGSMRRMTRRRTRREWGRRREGEEEEEEGRRGAVCLGCWRCCPRMR